jgi:hypothetical protein
MSSPLIWLGVWGPIFRHLPSLAAEDDTVILWATIVADSLAA